MGKSKKIKIKFWKTDELDNGIGDSKHKTIEVNLRDRKQLYDIIKKRHQYKIWQPEYKFKRDLVYALEKLDIAHLEKERKRNA